MAVAEATGGSGPCTDVRDAAEADGCGCGVRCVRCCDRDADGG